MPPTEPDPETDTAIHERTGRMVEGDVAALIRRNFSWIRHIQIAGVPDRHEPDTGDLDYGPIFALLDELGYAGWIGCEYNPAGDTEAGLAWARPFLD